MLPSDLKNAVSRKTRFTSSFIYHFSYQTL